MASSESDSLPDVEVPDQPECHSFPKCSFGKSKVVHRAFQGSWFLKGVYIQGRI